MKRIISVLVLLNVIILIFGWSVSSGSGITLSFYPDRAWHQSQQIKENFENGNWINNEKAVFHYNEINPVKIDSMSVYSYDDQNSSWVKMAVARYTYMPDQNYVTYFDLNFLNGSVYQPVMRGHFFYTVDFLLYAWCMYQFENNAWVPMNRTTISYEENDDFHVMEWNADNEGEPQYRLGSFETDDLGRIVEEEWISSLDSLNWVNQQHRDRVYHPNDTTSGEWFRHHLALTLPLAMMSEDGPSFGMVSSELEKNWSGSDWVNSNLKEYNYNTDDLLTEILRSEWQNNVWVNQEKDLYAYYTNNNLYQATHQYFNGTEWSYESRETYLWTEFVNSDDVELPSPLSEIIAYPNPFSDQVNFKYNSKSSFSSEVKIYNVKGQLVKTIKYGSHLKWDGYDNNGNRVSDGLYFVMITSQGQSKIHKIMKLKQ